MCRKFWNRRKYRSKGTVQEIDCQTTERHFRNRKIIDPLWARIKSISGRGRGWKSYFTGGSAKKCYWWGLIIFLCKKRITCCVPVSRKRYYNFHATKETKQCQYQKAVPTPLFFSCVEVSLLLIASVTRLRRNNECNIIKLSPDNLDSVTFIPR